MKPTGEDLTEWCRTAAMREPAGAARHEGGAVWGVLCRKAAWKEPTTVGGCLSHWLSCVYSLLCNLGCLVLCDLGRVGRLWEFFLGWFCLRLGGGREVFWPSIKSDARFDSSTLQSLGGVFPRSFTLGAALVHPSSGMMEERVVLCRCRAVWPVPLWYTVPFHPLFWPQLSTANLPLGLDWLCTCL